MPYEEVPGRNKNSKGFLCTPDKHLYRINRKISDTQYHVYCYHSRKTKDSNIDGTCSASGVMDTSTKKITLKKKHHHLADIQLLQVIVNFKFIVLAIVLPTQNFI